MVRMVFLSMVWSGKDIHKDGRVEKGPIEGVPRVRFSSLWVGPNPKSAADSFLQQVAQSGLYKARYEKLRPARAAEQGGKEKEFNSVYSMKKRKKPDA